jgi:hypothetical protein
MSSIHWFCCVSVGPRSRLRGFQRISTDEISFQKNSHRTCHRFKVPTLKEKLSVNPKSQTGGRLNPTALHAKLQKGNVPKRDQKHSPAGVAVLGRPTLRLDELCPSLSLCEKLSTLQTHHHSALLGTPMNNRESSFRAPFPEESSHVLRLAPYGSPSPNETLRELRVCIAVPCTCCCSVQCAAACFW